MKLRLKLSRAPSPPPPQVVAAARIQPQKVLKLPPSLLQDPAFSTNPQSHPYFPKEEPELALPGHPVLRRQQQRGQQPSHSHRTAYVGNKASDLPGDAESIRQLVQPPNTPMPLSRAASRHELTSKPVAILDFPQPILSQANRRTLDVQETDGGRPKLVKKLGLLTKKRGGKEHKSSRSHDGHTTAGPSDEHREPPQAQLQRHNSAPEPRRAEQTPVRLGISSQITATGFDGRAAQQTTQPIRVQKHDLDRIDELDESNIFGVSLHHDGPYEAVKAVLGPSSRMPLGYQNDGRLHNYHERMLKTTGQIYQVPVVPDDTPLNLSPGQLLPRNFKREQRKAPRFRHFVSPVLPQLEAPVETPADVEPVLPPRHQHLNHIPFHGRSNRSARRNGNRAAAHDNPLDGPPIDPAVIIGLAMMREASDLSSRPPSVELEETIPIEASTDPEDDTEMDTLPYTAPADQPEGCEFNPYDPKHLEAHPAALNSAEELDHEEPYGAASVQSHMPMSEEEFHSSTAEAVRLNPQFEGIPSGVQITIHPDSATMIRSPSPQARHPPGGSEETLVQNDDDSVHQSIEASVNVEEKPDIIISKESGVVQIQVQAKPRLPKEQDANQEPVGANVVNAIPVSEVVTRPIDKRPDETANSPRPNIDDVASSTAHSHSTINQRYDKQLPPPPPLAVPMAIQAPPAYAPEPTYVVPQNRGGSGTSGIFKPVQRLLQRNNSTGSTQLSANSQKSVSSTKVEDGHSALGSHVSSNVKPSASSKPQKVKPPPYTIPSLAGFGRESYDRYPQPIPAKRPAPQPAQEQRVYVRSQSRNGSSVTSSSRSQLSPIREDETSPRAPPRNLPTHTPAVKPSRAERRPEKVPSSSQPYDPRTHIQVGQVYPQPFQHTTPPPSAPHTASNVKPSSTPSHQSRPPLAPVAQPPSYPLHTSKTPEQGLLPNPYESNSVDRPEKPVSRSPSRSQEENLNRLDPIKPQNIADPENYPQRRPLSGVPENGAKQEFSQPQAYRPPQHPFPEQPRYDADNASSIRPEDSASNRARSITSYAPSAVMSMRQGPPPFSHRHRPKKLVMPTPLQPQVVEMVQQQAANSSQLYKDIFQPRPPPSVPGSERTSRRREPSPPHVLPPILSAELKPDAQTTRKLKKRNSHFPSRDGELAPDDPLNFDPSLTIPSDHRSIKSNEKRASRLTKRRTNL